MVAAKFVRVSKSRPCPVCEGDHKCSFTEDGLFLCGRLSGEQPGFTCLGPSKNPTWTMYRNADDAPPAQLTMNSLVDAKDTLAAPGPAL